MLKLLREKKKNNQTTTKASVEKKEMHIFKQDTKKSRYE
jgi:hypothetical protein